MYLIITVDTEEDDWANYSTEKYSLLNIERIPYLQELFDAFDVKPTYLITHPVATDKKSIDILQDIEKSGRCEIGMHCHPWNTPPFGDEINGRNSMLCNLPSSIQYDKMSFLHNIIITNFDVRPVSFRSGRWGYSKEVAENLLRLGYKVDTSITPYVDWTAYHGPDFSMMSPRPFRFSSADIFKEDENGSLLEVPATIAFLQQNCAMCGYIDHRLRSKHLSRLGIIGLLEKFRLLNKVWLAPEISDSKQMIKLAQSLLKTDCKVVNMFFHSTTLKSGLNQFVKTESDKKQFMQRIKDFLVFAKESGIESIKLSDTVKLFSLAVSNVILSDIFSLLLGAMKISAV